MTRQIDIAENRKANLAFLVKISGGQAAVGREMSRDRNQVWQWLLPSGVSGHRNMRTSTAKEFEDRFGRPAGWMDADNGHRDILEALRRGEDVASMSFPTFNADTAEISGDFGAMSRREVAALSGPKRDGDLLLLKQHDAWGSMGDGALVQDHVDVVRAIQVSLSELRRQVRGPITSPENLSILPAYGTSMSPTLNNGDPLVVDTGVSEIDREGVYVLERNGKLFVKRMQRLLSEEALLMISDNRDEHPYPEKIPLRMVGRDFHIRGRVLMVWNARSL